MAASTRGRLAILFGSQTGCAEEVARQLASEAIRRRFEPTCCSMDEYDVSALPTERHAIFVVSTTGEGEVPDGMRPFWQFLLRKDLPAGSLGGVRSACFGCGDSSYPKFNFAAKRLSRRLQQLGSEQLVAIGLGDDQDALGLDQALGPWLVELWRSLDRCLPLPNDLQVLPEDWRPPARYEVSEVSEARWLWRQEIGMDDASRAPAPPAAPSKATPFLATLRSNERLTAQDSDRDVRHIALDVSGWGLRHAPGDALAVQPRNPRENVRALVLSLGLDPGARLRVIPVAAHAPRLRREHWTVLELFEEHLDVFGVPRRGFFAALSGFATETMHAERLAEFGAISGAKDLLDYATRPRRTYAEVLLEFATARPPLAYYLDLIPPLRERYFSIASSAELHPTEVHLCVAVVRYQTRLSIPRFGVCSTYLSQLEPTPVQAAGSAAPADCGPASKVAVWLRRGCLTMPADPTAPVIMIGPGTGVAPFRAFVQSRQAWKEQNAPQRRQLGAAWLFFGCRRPDEDHLYEAEWGAHLRSAHLDAYRVAFSRVGEKKHYVQHEMVATESVVQLWQLLSHDMCHVYIAGSANRMPKDVRNAIQAIAKACGGMDDEGAAQFLKRLEASRRLQAETW